MSEFGVVILSSKVPRAIARLVERIHQEVPAARVRGILYERHIPKRLPERLHNLWNNLLGEPGYPFYAARKALDVLSEPLRWLGAFLLRTAHACPANPNGPEHFGLEDLERFASSAGCSLLATTDLHSVEALEFVRGLHADLGILYGARILKPELYDIPRLGSISIHKRKVPEYRGGGPIGLWELLQDQREIGITVHRVVQEVDAGPVIHATTIPIELYDNLRSLALKAALVGDDLLIVAVDDFVRGTVAEKRQTGPVRRFKAPKAHELAFYEKQLADRRPAYRVPRGRPAWKLLLRTLFFLPLVLARNWMYRFRKSFPVVILYHHLITDRPHHLGAPTACFDRLVAFLRRYYRVASLPEAIEMLQRGRVEAPTVVLTFDDGYAENFINLRAVTEEQRIPVALFVSTAHISDQQPFAHDLREKQYGFRPLTWEQVRFLSKAGYEFGAHTRTHFDCGSTDQTALREEIVGSKADLETHLDAPVKFFSFPWGLPANMSAPALDLARATYPFVFGAAGGVNLPSRDSAIWFLHRWYHPSDLWELELLLQSLLDLGHLRNTLPGLLGETSRSQSKGEAPLLQVPHLRPPSLGGPGPRNLP